ncbi:MAG: 30S ribosomal protein S8e [archaeon]|nr:MAG: 30S ribosomal protein S8e [archaeon]
MKTGKKFTGARYKKSRKKKLSERKGHVRQVTLGKEKKKKIKTTGGKLKTVLLRSEKVNVLDPKTKKCKVVKIKNVLEVPSNSFLVRRNVLVKNALIETELGKARITNRPSQEASIQAILVA